jgi:hypothetical protein
VKFEDSQSLIVNQKHSLKFIAKATSQHQDLRPKPLPMFYTYKRLKTLDFAV